MRRLPYWLGVVGALLLAPTLVLGQASDKTKSKEKAKTGAFKKGKGPGFFRGFAGRSGPRHGAWARGPRGRGRWARGPWGRRPGPWARGPWGRRPGPWARGPWGRRPGPWARGPWGRRPGPWARGPGGPPKGRFGGPPFGGPAFAFAKLKLTDEQKKKVGELRKKMREEFLKILTPEQRKTLEKFEKAFGGKKGPGKKGGKSGAKKTEARATDLDRREAVPSQVTAALPAVIGRKSPALRRLPE
jgi:hypothetical protein